MCLKTDGTLWSWGYGNYGRGGHNDEVNRSSPTQIGSDTTWTTAYVHGRGGGGIKSDGTLWMWGINNEGILGQNDRTAQSSPIQIPGTTWQIIRKGQGYNTNMVIKTDGTMWGWGGGSDGMIGNNNSINISSPVQIPGTTWETVTVNASWSAALKQ